MTAYTKTPYGRLPVYGFNLNHTVGPDAEGSTLRYLHHTTNYMLIYFLQGTGFIKVEGRHYDLNPGDVALLAPTELYHFFISSKEYHERLVLHIDPAIVKGFPVQPRSLFAPFTDREAGEGNRIPAKQAQDSGIHSCLDCLFELVKTPTPTNDLLSICKTVELLTLLGRCTVSVEEDGTQSAQSNPLVDRILDYLNRQFQEEITLNSVASEFNVTPSYLSHLFKAYTGMSPWNYVVLRRLHTFNELLPAAQSVEEACYQAGFQNYSNFFRLYKKHMGMTPIEYKKKVIS